MASEVVDQTSGKSEAANTLSAPSQESDYTTAADSTADLPEVFNNSGQQPDERYTTLTNVSQTSLAATGTPHRRYFVDGTYIYPEGSFTCQNCRLHLNF